MDDINSQVGDSLSGPKSRAPEPRLESLAKALAKVFRGRSRMENVANSAYFKVFIAEADSGGGGGMRRPSPGYASASPGIAAVSAKKRVVNYWCFSTGVAMEDLKRLGIRSLILTSGMLMLPYAIIMAAAGYICLYMCICVSICTCVSLSVRVCLYLCVCVSTCACVSLNE